jgi:hypothetical protein
LRMTEATTSGGQGEFARMRTFWKVLAIILLVLLLADLVILLSMYWWPGIPSSPRPAEGRVYPLNNHATYTYMNRREYLLEESLRWIFPALFFPLAAIIHFIDPFDAKRRWRPMIPPRPW